MNFVSAIFFVPLLWGIALGGVTVAAMAVGGVHRQSGTWATTIVAIAAFYVVFAIENGALGEVLFQAGIAGGFAVLAIIGARTYQILLVAALFAHGIYDLLIALSPTNPAPEWWGPFCLGIDFVLAGALAVILSLERKTQSGTPQK